MEHNQAIYAGYEISVQQWSHDLPDLPQVMTRVKDTDEKFGFMWDAKLRRACEMWLKSYQNAISLQEFLDGTGLR